MNPNLSKSGNRFVNTSARDLMNIDLTRQARFDKGFIYQS